MPVPLDSPLNYARQENTPKTEKHIKIEKTQNTQNRTNNHFIGVEGGASKTTICLVSQTGKIIETITGESTNPFTVPAERCLLIFKQLITEILKLHPEKRISCAGFALSGGQSEETEQIKNQLELEFPQIGECYFTIDTYGAIATACEKGGIVLIAGTGSNGLIVDANGKKLGNCGGWGHLFGDEGSAFDIAKRAMQLI